MNEEELREALEKLRVEDVLFQTAATLIDLAARRLGLMGEGAKEPDQAKTAIDAVRALAPLLPEEQQNAMRDPLSQLQLAYAREVQGGGASAGGADPSAAAPPDAGPGPDAGQGPEAGGGPGAETTGAPAADDAERAKARAKIWTPPGS